MPGEVLVGMNRKKQVSEKLDIIRAVFFDSTLSAFLSASEKIETVLIPILFAVLITRHAISPRLAIKIFLNIGFTFNRAEFCKMSWALVRNWIIM